MSNTNNIDKDVVKNVALLARLSMSESDTEVFREQLGAILGYIDQLNEVDVEGVTPTTHVLPSMKNVFREDIPHKCLPNEEVIANAPDSDKNFFKVPKVV